jgi:GNAT superfamily N-acetyltransferase
MKIRRDRPADVDLVVRMRVAFMADHRGIDPSSFSGDFVSGTHAFVERRMRDATMRSWLAEDDAGRCVGIVSILDLDMPPRPGDNRTAEGYIINMYVEPDARRQGIGRRLFDACIASAPGADIRRLLLHATDDGRPLYEAAGFAPNASWMELRVPAAPP